MVISSRRQKYLFPLPLPLRYATVLCFAASVRLECGPRPLWSNKRSTDSKRGATRPVTIIPLTIGLLVHTHTCLTALCPGLPRRAGTWKVKPIWILLKQETVSGSGISWATCKCAPRSRQITMPAPRHSDFYRPDAQPTASKHWRDQRPFGNR